MDQYQNMENDLERFVKAQETVYGMALAEIRRGRKQTHWMWFVFPQLRGLGQSHMSYFYGISGAEEARQYLAHALLSARLYEISEAILALEGNDPVRVVGPIDAQKLFSSMTLFHAVSGEAETVFSRVLDKYYGGKRDTRTLLMLAAD